MSEGFNQTRGVVLLHVTPKRNRASIERHGVLPCRSLGKRRWSYYCDLSGLVRILAHTAKRHEVDIDDLDVYTVEISLASLKRTKWPQYFASDRPGVPIQRFTPDEAIELAEKVLYG